LIFKRFKTVYVRKENLKYEISNFDIDFDIKSRYNRLQTNNNEDFDALLNNGNLKKIYNTIILKYFNNNIYFYVNNLKGFICSMYYYTKNSIYSKFFYSLNFPFKIKFCFKIFF
jgi:hypothetical protein